jgi:hypothetical protein
MDARVKPGHDVECVAVIPVPAFAAAGGNPVKVALVFYLGLIGYRVPAFAGTTATA